MTVGLWALAGVGKPTEGIALLRAGLAAYRATGAATYVPFYLTLLADAEGKANELDQGLGHLAEAEGLVAESEERWTEAELHRGPRGIAAQGGDRSAAAFAELSALRNSKVRNSGSCASPPVLPGSGASRVSVMTPGVFSHPSTVWFAEGFDTPVLKEAKALLDELVL